ncbi:metal ABC transporter substrate-binding protein [Chloroflexota bacterium]
MKRFYTLIIGVVVLSLVIAGLLGGCTPAGGTSGLKVVTSTSLIGQIVARVGGDKVEVVNIIPPAQCPGHFDVTPGDIQKLADADLFFLHGWQGEKFTQELITSASNADLTVVTMNLEGNWMTPPVQQAATDEITAALSRGDAENGAAYQKSGAEYRDIIAAKGAEIKSNLAVANLSSVNVLCAEQQAGFVKWAGLNVVATFGRPDTMTPQVVRELVDTGRAADVILVVDNMQSGQDAGAGVAEELGVKRIILSNFPGCYEDTETWEKALDYNIRLILEAVSS